MKILTGFVLVSAAMTVVVAYGYKYTKNPNSGDCKVQLSLPGGSDQNDAYPGIMNTRYGSSEGKYQQGSSSSGNYGHNNHHEASGTSNSNRYAGSQQNTKNNNYGGSSSEYGSANNNYGSSSSNNHESGNYGASSTNYESSKGINYESGSNYGSSNNANKNYGNDNYGNSGTGSSNYGSSVNYESSRENNGNYGSSSSNSNKIASNSYGSSNRDRDQDRYGSSNYDNERNTNNQGSSYERDRDTGSYGSSSNKEHSSSNYGSSSNNNNQYGSASSSSGHRGSGHRGSSASYGGTSSSENGGYGQQQTTNYNFWDREFANEVLSKHNSYRVQHTTPTVSLDDKMSKIAQDWAVQLATGATYGHSPEAVEGEYGESIQVLAVPPTGNEVVSKWYQEKVNYNFRRPTLVKSPPFKANRHFTAVVWYGTRKIGVGKATSNDGRTFVVVNYWPPGNIFDVLEDNVLPSRSDV